MTRTKLTLRIGYLALAERGSSLWIESSLGFALTVPHVRSAEAEAED